MTAKMHPGLLCAWLAAAVAASGCATSAHERQVRQENRTKVSGGKARKNAGGKVAEARGKSGRRKGGHPAPDDYSLTTGSRRERGPQTAYFLAGGDTDETAQIPDFAFTATDESPSDEGERLFEDDSSGSFDEALTSILPGVETYTVVANTAPVRSSPDHSGDEVKTVKLGDQLAGIQEDGWIRLGPGRFIEASAVSTLEILEPQTAALEDDRDAEAGAPALDTERAYMKHLEEADDSPDFMTDTP